MWAMYLENADAETCFVIDKEYKLRFGYWALKEWMQRRRIEDAAMPKNEEFRKFLQETELQKNESMAYESLIIPTQITLNGVKTTFTVITKKPKGWDDKPEKPK